MSDAGGTFDYHLEAELLRAAHRSFNRRDECVDRIDIRGVADFRDHDLVEPVGSPFEDVYDIAIPKGGIQAVYPNRERLLSPVDLFSRLYDVPARLGLLIGRNAVFQVKVDDIGCACGHLLKQ